jgi:fucose permease
MSTIITAAIVILSTTGIALFFISINKRNNSKRNKALLHFFNKAGAEKGLAFSSQEVLKNKIIGLDGLHQTLSVFEFLQFDNVIHIRLSDVTSCVLKKEYETVNFGNGKAADTEQHLRYINLKFTFRNGQDPVYISFYDSNFHTIYEMAELEAKTKTWETILSKIIRKDVKKEAASILE